MKNTLYFFICVFLISGCGDGDTTGTGQYSTSPAMTSLTAISSGASSITLVATATDDMGVTAYCFSNSSVKPLASDTCFTNSNSKTILATSAIGRYYVWAKDAFGHISPTALSGPCSTSAYAASDSSSLNTICMMTSLGELVFELDSTHAPISTANFLKNVNSGFYTNLVFHRITNSPIPYSVVQGGGFTYSTTSGLTSKTATTNIVLEPTTLTGLSNTSGTLAMARGSALDSANSQFYINTVDNSFSFDGALGYAVFGRVISGNNALSQIKNVSVINNGSGENSLPTNPPVIQWVYQIK